MKKKDNIVNKIKIKLINKEDNTAKKIKIKLTNKENNIDQIIQKNIKNGNKYKIKKDHNNQLNINLILLNVNIVNME